MTLPVFAKKFYGVNVFFSKKFVFDRLYFPKTEIKVNCKGSNLDNLNLHRKSSFIDEILATNLAT